MKISSLHPGAAVKAGLLVLLSAALWLPVAALAKAPGMAPVSATAAQKSDEPKAQDRKSSKKAKTDCLDCHERSEVLPQGHEPVKSTAIASCGGDCHKAKPGTQTPNPIVADLHRSHFSGGVSCKSCHTLGDDGRFAVAGARKALGSMAPEHFELLKAAAESWAEGPNLASLHGNKKQLSCGACHGTQLIPDDNETVLNASCVDCHGDYQKMAAKSRPKLRNAEINPHASHLGAEIACTVCHQGHSESKAYCSNCHTNFVMPMPDGVASTR